MKGKRIGLTLHQLLSCPVVCWTMGKIDFISDFLIFTYKVFLMLINSKIKSEVKYYQIGAATLVSLYKCYADCYTASKQATRQASTRLLCGRCLQCCVVFLHSAL
jgi:hypothetical protein